MMRLLTRGKRRRSNSPFWHIPLIGLETEAGPPNSRGTRGRLYAFAGDISEAIGNADDYFLGTIVVVSDGAADPSIADGRQRTATATIPLARIRDRLFSIGRGPSARSIDIDCIHSTDRNTEAALPRIKLNLEDNEFFVGRSLTRAGRSRLVGSRCGCGHRFHFPVAFAP